MPVKEKNFQDSLPPNSKLVSAEEALPELRYNPVLERWVIIAAGREARPQMPKDFCPFCPGQAKTPSEFEVWLYPNDFPSLRSDLETVILPEKSAHLFETFAAYGTSDVVIYSPQHEARFSAFEPQQLNKILQLWKKRYNELAKNPKIKYVLIFENKGSVIGVTMPHPHGQIFGYPFVPKRIREELQSSYNYYHSQKGGTSLAVVAPPAANCLHCRIISEEQAKQERVLYANQFFIAFVPFWADFPFEVNLYSKRHLQSFCEFSPEEDNAFMEAFGNVVRAYDQLYGFELPFMMGIHQAPTDKNDYSYYHFHVEFYPLHRSQNNIKYCAGSETAAGAHVNPSLPEDRARQLRKAFQRSLINQEKRPI